MSVGTDLGLFHEGYFHGKIIDWIIFSSQGAHVSVIQSLVMSKNTQHLAENLRYELWTNTEL